MKKSKGEIALKYIRSLSNPRLKNWKKLHMRKMREKTGTFLVEGFHLVEEALKSDSVLELIVSESVDLPPGMDYGDIPVTVIAEEAVRTLADTETPQGIFAVCKIPREEKYPEGKKYLLIDSVQDPGNLGTLIRTADACGMDAVVAGKGCVDIYNGKVVRSAQGSHFHLPVVTGDLFEWVNHLKKKQIPVFGTALENGVEFREVPPQDAFALIVGNEGIGVNKELLKETDKNLYIPMFGKSDSLNVAVAAGILLYHLGA